MGVEPTQDESIAPQTVLKTAAVTGPRAAPPPILSRRRSAVTPAGFKTRTLAVDSGQGMPPREPKSEPLTDTVALTGAESAVHEAAPAGTGAA